MVENPAFKEKLAKALMMLNKGMWDQARSEFMYIKLTCQKMVLMGGEEEEYWESMADGMQEFVDWIDEHRGSGPSGISSEKKREIEQDLRGFMQADSAEQVEGIRYREGVGGEEQSVTSSSTEEVIQDQKEFLEEELRKSEKTVMELKQELDALEEDS